MLSQRPLPVFDAWPYKLGKTIAHKHNWFVTFFIVVFFVEIFHSAWLSWSVDGIYVLASAKLIKPIMLFATRLWIRIATGFIFTYKLFLCNKSILKLKQELTHHKFLYSLQGDGKYRCLKLLHKECGGDDCDQEQSPNIVSRTVDILHTVLKWLSMATLVFAVFLPVVLYKISDLVYDSAALSDLPSAVFWMSIWDPVSLSVTLLVIGQTFAFFVYEQRLKRYGCILVVKGDEEVQERAHDFCQKLAERWKWLEWYTFFTIGFLALILFAHVQLDLPLTSSCLPYPDDFSLTKWVYCILLITLASMLTFMNVENWLRVGKRAVCLVCPPIMLVHDSYLRTLIGTEGHLHLLLYLVPLIILLWISWTFFWSHLTDSKLHRCREQQHGVYCTLHALSMVVTFLCIVTATYSELMYISSQPHQLIDSSCSNAQIPPPNPLPMSDGRLLYETHSPQAADDNCHEVEGVPVDPTLPRVGPVLIKPSLPPSCQFHRGQYFIDLNMIKLYSHEVILEFSLRAQLYKQDSPQVKCMCPSNGKFIVVFHSSEPIRLLITSQSHCTEGVSLEVRQPWQFFFTLIFETCVNIKPTR